MPFPTIADDGRVVTLDLHGATTAEAEKLLRSCVRIASTRGRRTLRIVHGTSTSELDRYLRTIKAVILEILDADQLDDYVSDYFTFEGHTTVSLNSGGQAAGDRMTIADLL